MKLSICIPTYNRADHLNNCLNSICIALESTNLEVEVCVSDNGSKDHTEEIATSYLEKLPLTYHKNDKNLGIPRNFLKVVSMAKGEFAWLVGDDDLLTPSSLNEIDLLFKNHPTVDFFFTNAYQLNTDYLIGKNRPIDTRDIPKDLERFSKYKEEGVKPFLELIDPKVSFDFLGGMFLSIFKRENWQQNAHVLNPESLTSTQLFSHFDNTFPHVKIFSHAFSHSESYFNSKPPLICLEGAREWAPMSPLIRSVRLVEALENYRSNGLSLFQYLKCKNFALRYLVQDIILMYIHKDKSGRQFVSLTALIFKNIFYPNAMLSIFYTLFRRVRRLF